MDAISESSETEKSGESKDLLTEAIGEFGIWHILIFIALSVPTKMSGAWTQMGIIFLAAKTEFRCVQTNQTDVIENSTCYSDCIQYEYYTEFENTIISQWDLICERAWLANFTQTIVMFGVLFGSIIFGFIADRYGRRPALLIASMLQLLSSLAEPFCPDYWSFTIVRFFLGTATAGILAVSFVILVEIIGPNKRELMNCIYHLPLAVGEMIMALFAYYLRSWNKFSIGIAIPNLFFLIYFLIVPESPKWLISMGRLKQACVAMTEAAKCNKLPTENMKEIVESIATNTKIDDKNQRIKATYIDLIRLRSLRLKNICSCVCWFILGVSYFGGNQYIGQTSSNAFITVVMAGAMQIPGILLCGYFCKRFGRRATAIIFFVISSISNGLLAVPDDWFHVKLAAGSIGVSSGSAAFSAMYIYTSELFPTVARNMAMGASSTASRIGSMIAPFIAGLSVEAGWIPPTVFCVAPLVAACACFSLPETKGKALEDYLVDT